MDNLKPCPFCGGEIEERGGQCNYGKKIMTLDLMCKKCGTLFKFKSKWIENPYREKPLNRGTAVPERMGELKPWISLYFCLYCF